MPVRWHREACYDFCYFRGAFPHSVNLIKLLLFVCFLNSDATGSFPDYPDEEEGGSALIFAEKDPQQVKYTQGQKYYLLYIFTLVCRRRMTFGVHKFFS